MASKNGSTASPHGTRARYNAGCRCGPCRVAASKYARELRARHKAEAEAAGADLRKKTGGAEGTPASPPSPPVPRPRLVPVRRPRPSTPLSLTPPPPSCSTCNGALTPVPVPSHLTDTTSVTRAAGWCPSCRTAYLLTTTAVRCRPDERAWVAAWIAGDVEEGARKTARMLPLGGSGSGGDAA